MIVVVDLAIACGCVSDGSVGGDSNVVWCGCCDDFVDGDPVVVCCCLCVYCVLVATLVLSVVIGAAAVEYVVAAVSCMLVFGNMCDAVAAVCGVVITMAMVMVMVMVMVVMVVLMMPNMKINMLMVKVVVMMVMVVAVVVGVAPTSNILPMCIERASCWICLGLGSKLGSKLGNNLWGDLLRVVRAELPALFNLR